jgi:aminopeptidase N
MRRSLRGNPAVLSPRLFLGLAGSLLLSLTACDRGERPSAAQTPGAAPATSTAAGDPHSFARPDEIAVSALELDLDVDFAARVLRGTAALELEHRAGARQVHLDTRDLEIEQVTLDEGTEPVAFTLGDEVPILGRRLSVPVTPATRVVRVRYRTRPEAAALQWLEPRQTAGGRHPFLFTQSQAILARTWVPCQDSPGVRMPYRATVRVPPGLLALMSAENPTTESPDGVYRFTMPQPVPSYLLALAVGDLDFRPLGPRTGVYAEPEVVERAAWELADTETMVEAAEGLYGPYRWGRYDLIVLPPSFPYGGMENPRLTFATPTILAGDRSLVALVAHELAHSWSGNTVTNADWNDFWLNEGFTTYFEHRIMEAVYGRPYSEMLATLSLSDLEREVEDLGATSPDTHLHLDLAGRDPDEGTTDVAYNKGYFFLRRIEETVGRERWDGFLRAYFDGFAFQSMTSGRFVEHLRRDLLDGVPGAAEAIDLEAWIYGPGIPANCPRPRSEELDRVEAQVAAFAGGAPATALATAGWTTHHWLHFLRRLPELDTARLADLDQAFELTASGNSEILAEWLERAIRADYAPAYAAVDRFLTGMGRRKFLSPLYEELAKTPAGRERALGIYARARPTYHPVAVATVDDILEP